MTYDTAASALLSLGLEHPPVALAWARQAPAGIASLEFAVVSSCALWRKAEREVFFASAEDHRGCAVGAHVMGLPLSAQTQTELAAAVGLMADVGYLRSDELAHIPQVLKRGAGVVYGPLAGFPLPADCAVLWATPHQAMLLGEALGASAWSPSPAGQAALCGRPACGALARTLNTGTESLSLGCAGMRTFTDIAPALTLFVISGPALNGLAAALGRMVVSNDAMLKHYQAQKDGFE